MATEYSSARLLAQKLINKKGRFIDVVYPAESIPNPDKPWEKIKGSPRLVRLKAVFEKSDRKGIEGTTLEQTEQKVMIAALDLEPDVITKNKNSIIDGGKTSVVVDVEELKPGEEHVMFTLFIRG